MPDPTAIRRTRATIDRLEPRTLFSTSPSTVLLADLGLSILDQTPLAGLTTDAAGDLFGATVGSGYDGTAYEIRAGTSAVTVVHTFAAGAGYPSGLPLADAAGDLFLPTSTGGAAGLGAVDEVPAADPAAVVTLASFSAATGINPGGGLVADAAGDLFGTTATTVFELVGGRGPVRTLAADAAVSGPASLALDAAGNVYGFGTNAAGAAVLFRIDAAATGYAAVVPITDGTAGDVPSAVGPPRVDAAGDLFAAVAVRGRYGSDGTMTTTTNEGFAFELPAAAAATAASAVTVLHAFPISGGLQPTGPLTADAAGDLFGPVGGAFPAGTVYEIAAGSGGVGTGGFGLVTPDAGGIAPVGPVVVTAAGAVLGVSEPSGSTADRAVFELLPAGVGIPTAVGVSTSAGTGSVGGGRPVTLTAAVTIVGGAAVSTGGTVTFQDDAGDVLGTATLQPAFTGTLALGDGYGGTVSVVTRDLPVGTPTVTATYAGDANFAPATSAAVAVTVTPPPPAATVGVTVVPLPPDPAVTSFARATVSVRVTSNVPGGPVPTGTVTLDTNVGQDAGEATVNGTTPIALAADGTATVTVTLSPGLFRFTADYDGDDANGVATAAAVADLTGPGAVPAVAADPLPATAAAGGKLGRPVRIRLTDPGVAGQTGSASVTAYAFLTSDPTYNPQSLDYHAGQPPAGVTGDYLGVVHLKLRSGGSATVSIPVPAVPPDVPAGTYYLVVGDDPGTGTENVAVAPATVTVTAAAVSPAVTVTATGPTTLAAGRGGAVRVTVANAGPAATTGLAIIEVGLNVDAAASASAVVYRVRIVRPVRVPAGRSVTFRLAFATTTDEGPATEFPIALVAVDGVVARGVGTTPFVLTGRR